MLKDIGLFILWLTGNWVILWQLYLDWKARKGRFITKRQEDCMDSSMFTYLPHGNSATVMKQLEIYKDAYKFYQRCLRVLEKSKDKKTGVIKEINKRLEDLEERYKLTEQVLL